MLKKLLTFVKIRVSNHTLLNQKNVDTGVDALDISTGTFVIKKILGLTPVQPNLYFM